MPFLRDGEPVADEDQWGFDLGRVLDAHAEERFVSEDDRLAFSIAKDREARALLLDGTNEKRDVLPEARRPPRREALGLELPRHVLRCPTMFGSARLPAAHVVGGEETDVLPPFLIVVPPRHCRRARQKDQWRPEQPPRRPFR